jgi:hypothetical protein
MSHELERLQDAHRQIPPPDPLVLDAVRRRLVSAAEREARSRRPRRGSRARRFALVGAAAVAAAAAVVVLPLPSDLGGTRTVDAIAKARAALAAPGKIVHYTVTVRREGAFERGCETGPMQVWRAAEPTRWHAVQPLPDYEKCGTMDFEMGGPMLGSRVELAYARGRTSTYVPEMDALQVIVDPPSRAGEGERRAPSSASNAASLQLMGTIVHARKRLISSPFPIGRVPDPVTGVEALLAAGELRDAGMHDRGGRRVRVLTGAWSRPGGIERTSMEYVVDAETFAPIEVTSVARAKGVSRTDTLHVTFGDYERIVLSKESAKLLEIQPERPPKVTKLTIEEVKGRPVEDGKPQR